MKAKYKISKRNTVKPNRDKRYEILDINQGARSEMQGFDLLFVLGGSSSDCGVNHYNCEHRNVTHLFTKVSPIKPQLAYSEKDKASRVFNSAMYRTILKLRDWSVMSSKTRQGYTILHPKYLAIAELTILYPEKGIHKVYRNR